MIKTIVALFILYFLFLKIYRTVQKLVENYKNKANIHIFKVQLADTPNKREKGLMFVKKLKKGQGMLFDFKKHKKISLIMKNTLIPLDAIFLNDKSEIVDLIRDMKAGSSKTYKSNKKAYYVLEVNSGVIDKRQIKLKDIIGTEELDDDITNFKKNV
jgi:uncharacterized membrane protein (UPF0127 family)